MAQAKVSHMSLYHSITHEGFHFQHFVPLSWWKWRSLFAFTAPVNFISRLSWAWLCKSWTNRVSCISVNLSYRPNGILGFLGRVASLLQPVASHTRESSRTHSISPLSIAPFFCWPGLENPSTATTFGTDSTKQSVLHYLLLAAQQLTNLATGEFIKKLLPFLKKFNLTRTKAVEWHSPELSSQQCLNFSQASHIYVKTVFSKIYRLWSEEFDSWSSRVKSSLWIKRERTSNAMPSLLARSFPAPSQVITCTFGWNQTIILV